MAKRRLFKKEADDALSEQRGVPFLRSFDWLAVALRTFRERPLPSAYTPTVQPTFDLFASSRLGEAQVEQILGDLGGIEVFGPRVNVTKYRLYLSVDVFHTDATAHKLLFNRVVPDPILGFPTVVFATSASPNAFYPGVAFEEHVAVQNVLVPPDGRMACTVSLPASMGGASRLQMRSLFIEFAVGEPNQDCVGG